MGGGGGGGGGTGKVFPLVDLSCSHCFVSCGKGAGQSLANLFSID